MVLRDFKPSTKEVEVGGWLRGQPGLQSDFQNCEDYTEKPCLQKNKEEKGDLRFFLRKLEKEAQSKPKANRGKGVINVSYKSNNRELAGKN